MKRVYEQKVRRLDKLSKKDQEELVFDLVNALVQARTVGDAALFLQDLLTKGEMKILARRLRIAKLLLSGMTYRQIETALHVSHATVAKIAVWLEDQGDGFRKIVEKLPRQKAPDSWTERSEWDSLKRQYSLYFWPELLLGEIVKSANKRQKERIRNVLEKLEQKSDLHKKIEQMLST